MKCTGYTYDNSRLSLYYRECELGPIVNRDLSRRIRTVNGITVDKKVVRNDIKLAAKVITNLDTRWQLWNAGETNGNSENLEQVDYFLSYKFVFMPAFYSWKINILS